MSAMPECKRCGKFVHSGPVICDDCLQTQRQPETRPSEVRSDALLGKIRTAWCHYNSLNAEYEYSLSEGGDTDVTRDQVEHAWEDLNSLIMPNASREACLLGLDWRKRW